jgi:hypothetical protein
MREESGETRIQGRLEAAIGAARDGRFEEALAGFAWFFAHSEEVDRVVGAGARTALESHALSGWADLGREYAPALDALEVLRSRFEQSLLMGERSRRSFLWVVRIDTRTEAEGRTYG